MPIAWPVSGNVSIPSPWPRSLGSLASSTPILVVGGTFDPPHLAHVALPGLVRAAVLPGSALLFVPAAVSPFKQGVVATPAHHRVAMLTRAIEGVASSGVWTDEIDRAAQGASYTIDTVMRLRTLRPAAALTLLIGADQAALFHRWKAAREIREIARVLVVLREPYVTTDALLDAMCGTGFWTDAELDGWRACVVKVPLDPVSATGVREEIRRKGACEVADRLWPGVLAYIQENHLYTDA